MFSVWTVAYAGPRLDLTAEGDDLALSVLKGITSSMEYDWDEKAELRNFLRLVIRKQRDREA